MARRHVALDHVPQQFLQELVPALSQVNGKPALLQIGPEGFSPRALPGENQVLRVTERKDLE
jgi:hypothetical protein